MVGQLELLMRPETKPQTVRARILVDLVFNLISSCHLEEYETRRDEMFEFGADDQPSSKCYVTHGSLPTHVDPRQPPTRKKPFSTILDHTFVHKVFSFVVHCATGIADLYSKLDLILPEEVFQIIWDELASKVESIRYAKVFLPLSALLEGDFFNIYIKSGIHLHISAIYCHISVL